LKCSKLSKKLDEFTTQFKSITELHSKPMTPDATKEHTIGGGVFNETFNTSLGRSKKTKL